MLALPLKTTTVLLWSAALRRVTSRTLNWTVLQLSEGASVTRMFAGPVLLVERLVVAPPPPPQANPSATARIPAVARPPDPMGFVENVMGVSLKGKHRVGGDGSMAWSG